MKILPFALFFSLIALLLNYMKACGRGFNTLGLPESNI